MNSGLLVVIALILIYLAVTGKYNCVTAGVKCVIGTTALCECGTQGAAQGKPIAGQLPNPVKTGIEAGRTIYDQTKEAIRRAKGVIGAK